MDRNLGRTDSAQWVGKEWQSVLNGSAMGYQWDGKRRRQMTSGRHDCVLARKARNGTT